MALLLNQNSFRDSIIPEDDPLRFYYYPLIKYFYHKRIDVAMSLIGTGKRVLEIGFGCGTSFIELHNRFEEVYGVDLHNHVGEVRKVYLNNNYNVYVCKGNVVDPPFIDGKFNAILAISIFEHLQPTVIERVMEQMYRILVPGGVLVVGMPGVNNLMRTMFKLFGVTIDHQHVSDSKIALKEAVKLFHIEYICNMPTYFHDIFLLYTWFKARKPLL